MTQPPPRVAAGAVGFLSGNRHNEFVDALQHRTPVDSDDLEVKEQDKGFTFTLKKTTSSTDYVGPFKLTCTNAEETITVRIGAGQFIAPGLEIQWTVAESTVGSSDGTAFLKVNGTTTNTYFTPSSAELGFGSVPSPTTTEKYITIGTVSRGVCTQTLKSDVYF
jgi:hypothetical protein